MAANSNTEEKRLPPSRIKIDRLRREGQVPRSRDLPVALSVLAISMWIVWSLGQATGNIGLLFDIGLNALDPTAAELLSVLPASGVVKSGRALLELIWPPLALGLTVVIVTSVIDAHGFPMSMKNMRFDANRLNPAEGFKKIFSRASLAEFLKSFVKLTLLLVAGGGAITYFLNAIFWAPACGDLCALSTAMHLIGTLSIISAAIMLLVALADIRISRALFHHEHRMTITEAKREQKDTHGDPHMKSERRRIAAEMRSAPPRKERP